MALKANTDMYMSRPSAVTPAQKLTTKTAKVATTENQMQIPEIIAVLPDTMSTLP